MSIYTIFDGNGYFKRGDMFGFGKKDKAIENQLGDWLAAPSEFGVKPAEVRVKRRYNANLLTFGKTKIHLLSYVMPDGTKGRGFVNPITWSFLGDEVNAIGDKDLVLAYCGWAWLFAALQERTVQTDFVSVGEEQRYSGQKAGQGITDISIDERYKIGTSELFGFSGNRDGRRVRGAGNTDGDIICAEDEPNYCLPGIYFLLGQQVIQSLR